MANLGFLIMRAWEKTLLTYSLCFLLMSHTFMQVVFIHGSFSMNYFLRKKTWRSWRERIRKTPLCTHIERIFLEVVSVRRSWHQIGTSKIVVSPNIFSKSITQTLPSVIGLFVLNYPRGIRLKEWRKSTSSSKLPIKRRAQGITKSKKTRICSGRTAKLSPLAQASTGNTSPYNWCATFHRLRRLLNPVVN
jgi:hypothetical protein